MTIFTLTASHALASALAPGETWPLHHFGAGLGPGLAARLLHRLNQWVMLDGLPITASRLAMCAERASSWTAQDITCSLPWRFELELDAPPQAQTWVLHITAHHGPDTRPEQWRLTTRLPLGTPAGVLEDFRSSVHTALLEAAYSADSLAAVVQGCADWTLETVRQRPPSELTQVTLPYTISGTLAFSVRGDPETALAALSQDEAALGAGALLPVPPMAAQLLTLHVEAAEVKEA